MFNEYSQWVVGYEGEGKGYAGRIVGDNRALPRTVILTDVQDGPRKYKPQCDGVFDWTGRRQVAINAVRSKCIGSLRERYHC